jgi:hypothetical protein
MYKRSLFFYLLIILVVLFPQNSVKVAASSGSDLYISEVWQNKNVKFSDKCTIGKTDQCIYDVWIELFNPTSKPVNLSDYKFDFRSNKLDFISGKCSSITGRSFTTSCDYTAIKFKETIAPNSTVVFRNKYGSNITNFTNRSEVGVSSLELDITDPGIATLPDFTFSLVNNLSNKVVDSFSKSKTDSNSSIQFCIDPKTGNKVQVESTSALNIDGKTFYATPGNQNDCPKPVEIAPPPPPVIETPTSPAGGLNQATQTATILNTGASGEIENNVETTKTIDEVPNTAVSTVTNQTPQAIIQKTDLNPEVQTQADSTNSNLKSKEDELKVKTEVTDEKIIDSQADNLADKNTSLVETEIKAVESVVIDPTKTQDNDIEIVSTSTEILGGNTNGGRNTIVTTDNNAGGPPGSGGNGGNASGGGTNSGASGQSNAGSGSTNFILIQAEKSAEVKIINEVKLAQTVAEELNSNPQTLIATLSDDSSNPRSSSLGIETAKQDANTEVIKNYLANNVIEVELQSTNNSSDFAFVQQSVTINPQISPSVVNQSQSFVISKSDSSSKVTLDMHSVKSGFIYFDLVLIIFLLTKSIRQNHISLSKVIESASCALFQKK